MFRTAAHTLSVQRAIRFFGAKKTAGSVILVAGRQDDGGLPPTEDENTASAHLGRWQACCPLYTEGICVIMPPRGGGYFAFY